MFLKIPIEILSEKMLGTTTFSIKKKLMFLRIPIEILSEKRWEQQLFEFWGLELELGAGSWELRADGAKINEIPYDYIVAGQVFFYIFVFL